MVDVLDLDTEKILVEELANRALRDNGLCRIMRGPFRFEPESEKISSALRAINDALGIDPGVVRSGIADTDRDGNVHELAESPEKPGVSVFIQRCQRHEPDSLYVGPSDYLSRLAA